MVAIVAGFERAAATSTVEDEDGPFQRLASQVAGWHSGVSAPRPDSLLQVFKGLLEFTFEVPEPRSPRLPAGQLSSWTQQVCWEWGVVCGWQTATLMNRLSRLGLLRVSELLLENSEQCLFASRR